MDYDEPKFFLLGLHALKPDPDSVIFTTHDDGSQWWEMAPGYVLTAFPMFYNHALGVVAASEERAWQIGMGKLQEQSPPDEGWILHHIVVHPISRADLLEISQMATGDHETDQEALVM